MKTQRVLWVVLALLTLAAQAGATIILDDTFDDTTTGLYSKAGRAMGWGGISAGACALGPGYVYSLNGGNNTPLVFRDSAPGYVQSYQPFAYVLTEDITAIRYTLYNANATMTAASFSSPTSAKVELSWYDSSQFTGTGGAGRHQGIVATFTRPAIAPGETVTIDIPVTAFAHDNGTGLGLQQFGQKGDALNWLWIGGLFMSPGTGFAHTDLRLLSVSFVPEPATLALVALGGMGALVRRRGR